MTVAELELSAADRAAIARGDYRADRWADVLARAVIPSTLTKRWRPLIPHPELIRSLRHPARYKVVVAGRRSGKTEAHGLRETIRQAMAPQPYDGPLFGIGAPTRDQVKRLYWKPLKLLAPPQHVRRIYDGELAIEFNSGARVELIGMDKPMRAEGVAYKRFVLDEYDDWKPGSWEDSIYPALQTIGQEGTAVFLGRPRRGSGQLAEIVNKYALNPAEPDYAFFHWTSDDLMSAEQVEKNRRSMDPRTYARNFQAKFVEDGGSAYYCFARTKHAIESVRYDRSRPLILCFDFNVTPGVCAYVQELDYRGPRSNVARAFTGVFGEVWIEEDSNSELVCREIMRDFSKDGRFGAHTGEVYLEGDPAGGAKGTAKVKGSDWDIILNLLRTHFPGGVYLRARKAAPAVRSRVNAMNTRLLNAAGIISMLVDPVRCPHVIQDLERVTWDDTGTELEKKARGPLTHLSDGIGYYTQRRWPVLPPSSGSLPV